MLKYLLKRIGQTILIVILVSVLTFFLVDLIPGDVVLNVAGKDDIDEAEYWKIYYELNLDKSTPERFVLWLKGVLKLDFGTSYIYHKPVWDLIKTNIPPTLYLSLLATLISVPIGVFFDSYGQYLQLPAAVLDRPASYFPSCSKAQMASNHGLCLAV